MESKRADESRRRWYSLAYESQIQLYAMLAGAPAVVVAFVLVAQSDASPRLCWTLGATIVACWVGFAALVRVRVVAPLRVIASLAEAVREGDFSLRGNAHGHDDALGCALRELGQLSATLRDRRLRELETAALLDRVIQAIDVAIFTFDRAGRLQLVNRAGETLLGARAADVTGATAEALGLAALLEGPTPRMITTRFSGEDGRWELRRASFRQQGVAHDLVVLSDLHRVLREEERATWRRLVRVLGHEINNSLGPLHSLATHLGAIASAPVRALDWEDDLRSGLAVIARRSEALGRFLTAYAQVARLPPPTRAQVDVAAWIERVGALEKRVPIEVRAGSPREISADADQLDQLLINLVRNAADASLETSGGVVISWSDAHGGLEVCVADRGPGVASTENLFVPFFTTKRDGNGIGLVLSRQIAEAHGGTLNLETRADGPGCVARLHLPR